MNEREAIVAWLRDGPKTQLGWRDRLLLALFVIVWPRQVSKTIRKICADRIDRGDHLEGKSDER